MEDDQPATSETVAANRRHDQEHGDPFEYQLTRIKCGWREDGFSRRGPLTDKQIAAYERAGYYTADFKAARRDLMAKKGAKRAAREGNFMKVEGRLVYAL